MNKHYEVLQTLLSDQTGASGIAENLHWVVALDTMVEDVHFPAGTSAVDVAYKSVAVNLSDLAAMGATPVSISIGLSVPDHATGWVRDFAAGMATTLEMFDIGLDDIAVASGSLMVCVHANGVVDKHCAVRRSGARPGDAIYVSGCLGDAAIGLQVAQENGGAGHQLSAVDKAYFLERLNRPPPRIALGHFLGGIATAAIDISDGLRQDLGHILKQSGVGATIWAADLPLSGAMRRAVDAARARQFALTAGDDFELCFTVPAAATAQLKTWSGETRLRRIGEVHSSPELHLAQANGEVVNLDAHVGGFDHFRA